MLGAKISEKNSECKIFIKLLLHKCIFFVKKMIALTNGATDKWYFKKFY